MIQPCLRSFVSSAAGLQTPNIFIASISDIGWPSSKCSSIAIDDGKPFDIFFLLWIFVTLTALVLCFGWGRVAPLMIDIRDTVQNTIGRYK